MRSTSHTLKKIFALGTYFLISQYLAGCGGSGYSSYSPDTRDANIVNEDFFKSFKNQFETEFGVSNLPNCKGTSFTTWSNCFGVHDGFAGLNRYIGEFLDGKYNGRGIRYIKNNESPYQIGLFKNDSYIYGSGKVLRNGELVRDIALKTESKVEQYIEKNQSIENDMEQLSNSNSDEKPPNEKLTFDIAKSKCKELGFLNETEGFGKCVLQLTK